MVNTPIDLDYLHTNEQQTKSNPLEPVVSCAYFTKGFEIGKYYKHTGGGYLHILCKANTTMWLDTLVAEEAGYGCGLKPVASDPESRINWIETTKEDWMTNFS